MFGRKLRARIVKLEGDAELARHHMLAKLDDHETAFRSLGARFDLDARRLCEEVGHHMVPPMTDTLYRYGQCATCLVPVDLRDGKATT